MNSHILEVHGCDSVELFKALSSETRVRMLDMLAKQPMNVNELAQALGMSQPTVTKHTQILEQIGLIKTEYMPGVQGMQKKCALNYDRFIVSFETLAVPEYNVATVSMPIGLYTLAYASPSCGLASSERFIAIQDDPQSFYNPDRAAAQLIWMADGFLEYVFPSAVNAGTQVYRLDLSMEICSEAPGYDHDYPSDITVWVNGVEIGTWTCPGDFGESRGRLNPPWWCDGSTQYGMLKVWSIERDGTYIDGMPISDVNLERAMILPRQPVSVRIGIKPDAEHKGGLNIFGRGFGNYEQDLVLRAHYKGKVAAERNGTNGMHEQIAGRHEEQLD